MAETLTITIDPGMKADLETRSRARGQSLDEFVKGLLCKGVREESEVTDPDEDLRNLPGVKEMLANYTYDPEEMLPCGMTVGEYDALNEEEREALWDEEFRKALDEDDEPEIAVSPTAVTARQRRAQALS